MGFKFGDQSKISLKTCHEDLQKVLKLAIIRSLIDFGVMEGHRPIKRQFKLYKIGRTFIDGEWVKTGVTVTNIDGYDKMGKHNYDPSQAVDIYIYHPNKETRRKIAYSREHLCYVSGVIQSCAVELLDKGLITHKIRHGANWDSDGVIRLDQSFNDYPHLELINI